MTNLKTVVVTGAGSGLGKELSKTFVALGYQVFGLGRNAEALTNTQSAVSDESKFDYYSVDITDNAALVKAVDSILSRSKSIDILINNAAIYDKQNFVDETPEQFSSAITANVMGIANTCKAVLPSMLEKNSGIIVNIGSWAHKRPILNSASYSASKAAVHSLTKAIATDLAEKSHAIKVIEWIPGHMNTQMSGFTGMDPAICAGWCAEILQTPLPENYGIFEGNQPWSEPLSLKQKIKKKLLGR